MGDNESINNRWQDDELFEDNASIINKTNNFVHWQNIDYFLKLKILWSKVRIFQRNLDLLYLIYQNL